jgi:hypothetical protein
MTLLVFVETREQSALAGLVIARKREMTTSSIFAP